MSLDEQHDHDDGLGEQLELLARRSVPKKMINVGIPQATYDLWLEFLDEKDLDKGTCVDLALRRLMKQAGFTRDSSVPDKKR